ncbi:MAG: hypothetical protein ACFB6R_08405 [Alphaproteobacteria bacterium]
MGTDTISAPAAAFRGGRGMGAACRRTGARGTAALPGAAVGVALGLLLQPQPARAVSVERGPQPVHLVEDEGYRFSVFHEVNFDSEHVFRGIQTAETGLHRTVRVDYGPFYGGYRGVRPFEEENAPAQARYHVFGGVKQSLMAGLTLDLGLQALTLPVLTPDAVANGAGSRVAIANEDRLAVEPVIRLLMDAPGQPALSLCHDALSNTASLEAAVEKAFTVLPRLDVAAHAAVGKVVSGTAPGYRYAGLGANIVTGLSDQVDLTAGLQWDRASRDHFLMDGEPGLGRRGSLRWGFGLQANF